MNGYLILSLPCDWASGSTGLKTGLKTCPKLLALSLLLSSLGMELCPLCFPPFPWSPVGSQTAILICKTGLEAWAVQGLVLGASSRASSQSFQEGPGLLPSPSAASSGCMDRRAVAGIWSLCGSLYMLLCGPWWDHPGGSGYRKTSWSSFPAQRKSPEHWLSSGQTLCHEGGA